MVLGIKFIICNFSALVNLIGCKNSKILEIPSGVCVELSPTFTKYSIAYKYKA